MKAALKGGCLYCRDNQFDDRLIQPDTEIDIGIVKNHAKRKKNHCYVKKNYYLCGVKQIHGIHKEVVSGGNSKSSTVSTRPCIN